MSEHVATLVRNGAAWATVFWKVWAVSHAFRCAVCDNTVACSDLETCMYHPERPQCAPGEAKESYACCQRNEQRFLPFTYRRVCKSWTNTVLILGRQGCQSRWHAVSDGDVRGQKLLVLARKHRTTIADFEDDLPALYVVSISQTSLKLRVQNLRTQAS